ncbi:SWIM zinc finger family protein [Ornithinimicrobium sufpigmenti]|uniref:SWIM zinc finger family protein n=1 Tax=Ornithinimicrobium sufpigmenti TaxID=2508882 RepID=UPI001035889E|nr:MULTISPECIES: SWIM zinc finger family protein [unclassified Ornithinimicrobium]
MSDRFWPAARPRAVEGGLRARSARGAIAQTWWGQRFIAVLEGVPGLGGRLGRGRTYARKGQVISLEVGVGVVEASVQGSRVAPYRVSVRTAAFGPSEWEAVERELRADAWYLARLLAGEMPEDVEEVFARAGLSLFPSSAADLAMDCSCPDWSVPCKHLAATFYLLAESFDEDPFRILAWRGRTREELLASLDSGSGSGAGGDDADEPGDVPLEDLLGSFFALQGELPGSAPPAVARLIDQVPDVGVVVRGRPLVEVLSPGYDGLGGPE